jgi:hypothetical protein
MNTSIKRMVTRVAKSPKIKVPKVKGPLPKGTKGIMAGPKAPKVKSL